MRRFIEVIKSQDYKDAIGAEIGVFKGANALDILNAISMKTLYLIDPYLEHSEQDRVRTTLDMRKAKIAMKKNLKRYEDLIMNVYKTSEDAADDIPNDLDFIYIDGSHFYEDVKKDIEIYYPKVKKGGIIGGDDYVGRHQGVIQAVNEFVEENGLDLNVAKYIKKTFKTKSGYIDDYEWWIIKK